MSKTKQGQFPMWGPPPWLIRKKNTKQQCRHHLDIFKSIYNFHDTMTIIIIFQLFYSSKRVKGKLLILNLKIFTTQS